LTPLSGAFLLWSFFSRDIPTTWSVSYCLGHYFRPARCFLHNCMVSWSFRFSVVTFFLGRIYMVCKSNICKYHFLSQSIHIISPTIDGSARSIGSIYQYLSTQTETESRKVNLVNRWDLNWQS
jgi:hypothetical protein